MALVFTLPDKSQKNEIEIMTLDHRSRVSARLVTRGSRDTVANIMGLE